MRFRNLLARWVLAATTFSPIAFIGGLFLGSLPLLLVAVGILALQAFFALVNLPLERDASRRAVRLLEEWGMILPSEERGIKRVLGAAAFTYLASVGVRLSLFLFWFIVFAAMTNLGGRL
jgi:Zn-dependent membrane protease YugP